MRNSIHAASAVRGWLCAFLAIFASLLVPGAALAAERYQPTRFSVETVGQGDDVILIPGLSSPREVWRPTAEALAATHRVHLVQLKGFGEPAGPNAQGPVLQPFVDELAVWMDAEGLQGAAVIGHSFGGLATLILAADHPELVGRALIVESLPWIGTIMGGGDMARTVALADQLRGQLLAAHAARDPSQPLPQQDCSAVVDDGTAPFGNLSNRKSALCRIGNWGMASDQRVVAQAMHDDMLADLRPRLAGITVPVGVIYAYDARIISQEQAVALWEGEYAALPGVRFYPIAGSYHFTMFDQPEANLAAIMDFLR